MCETVGDGELSESGVVAGIVALKEEERSVQEKRFGDLRERVLPMFLAKHLGFSRHSLSPGNLVCLHNGHSRAVRLAFCLLFSLTLNGLNVSASSR